MQCIPKLIQPRSFAWEVNSAFLGNPPHYYNRAQPLWDEQLGPMSAERRILLGWKVWASIGTVDNEAVELNLRVDVGGGQTDTETPSSRPIVAFHWPLTAGSFFPNDSFAATNDLFCFERDTNHHVALSDWPGIGGTIPVWCNETVRLLVRTPSTLDPQFEWSAQINLTLWIGSE